MKKVYYGRGTLQYLAQFLQAKNLQRVLLVTRKNTYDSFFHEKLYPFIKDCDVLRFDDYEANPNDKDLYRGIQLYQSFQPDVVIGLGGGSALDMAKLLALFGPNSQAIGPLGLIEDNLQTSLKPMVFIPTTAGTGSEATHFAVLYIEGKKHSIAHAALRAQLTLIDPNLYQMPKPLAASSGLDAMTQAIESIWSMQATRRSIQYAKRALMMIRKALVLSVLEKNPNAIEQMCFAAYLSGKAIDVSKTTAPHALSYHISMQYDVPHGIAVALNMLPFLSINSADSLDKYGHIMSPEDIQFKNRVIYEALGVQTAQQAQRCLIQWMLQLDVPTTYREVGLIDEEQLQALVLGVNEQRMKNNPFQLTHAQLESCLKAYHFQDSLQGEQSVSI